VDLPDFHTRTRLPHRLIERLILVGAMDSWDTARRDLLWQLGELPDLPDALPIPAELPDLDLPPFERDDLLAAEYEVLGLSTGEHVMMLYRDQFRERGILGYADLPLCKDGSVVRVAGLVVVHQSPPTAKGHHFVTLEDEDGMMNVIIRPLIYEQYREVIVGSPLLIVTATVQKRGEVINLLALSATTSPLHL
jgi:error-prone DNA polymerase